jgi:hypothetical protein
MSFSYYGCAGLQDQIDFVRLLISDTQEHGHIFSDSEIAGAYRIQASVFQSSMFYNSAPGGGTIGSYLPYSPVSYLRVSALLLDSLANNKARLSSIKKVLDVQLDARDAAAELHNGAKIFRDIDDESGAMMIIEQVNTSWSFFDRWWATVQRQLAI